MKKSNKKTIIVVVSILVTLLIVGLIVLVFSSRNSNSLTLEENKWIDSNKQNVIDIAIMNDIPVLSNNGEGLIYNYLDYVTKEYSLKFNIIPNKLDNVVDYQYNMDLVFSTTESDIILLEDNLVLVTLDNKVYTDLNDITNLTLGVTTIDKEIVSNYLSNNNITFVEYTTYTELKESMVPIATGNGTVTAPVNGIIIPKTISTQEIVQNSYNVSYHFDGLNKYFVLKTTGQKELNSILHKSFNNWKENEYITSYNTNLLNNYYSFKNITDTDQKKLHSKSYSYGFIDDGIFNTLDNNKITGINELVLKDFNKFSNISITYIKYNSISKLLKEFNSEKLDFIMDIVDGTNYTNEVYITTGLYNKQLVIISGIGNKDIINGVKSLKNKEVLTIKDSYLEKYLTDNGIKVRLYNNFTDLSIDFSSNDIAIIDLENYNFYKTSAFKDSKINYILDSNDKYKYVINGTEENTMFKDMFNFYLNYNSTKELVLSNYDDIAYRNTNIIYILIFIIFVLCIYLVVDFSNHLKVMLKKIRENKKIHLSKEDKIKYIDQLTSLKNRAYLNSKIESWDESEVYPQSIIVIDLNNVSYINDNYGREEGDKVIAEAANILIQHQMQNSEIIRTDGNEFLIYLVGYEEKQIISYLRKLNKELKGLSHGFGAASGYSIITDAIKTVDDAVNEATLDMKNNKEDIDY
ncbi:MAG: GGDEF domain-containing protein [Bacilli bacterium]|nr:GGDEF domain-containing protein [Bacilli bacterium]